MENLNAFITHPAIYILLATPVILKYKNELLDLLPNNKKKLNKLVESRNLTKKKDKNLNRFLDDEIEKINFAAATGLTKNKRNEELLNFYIDNLKEHMIWSDFKKITKYIKNTIDYKKVRYSKVRIIYLACIFWASCFIFSIVGACAYFLNKYDEVNLDFINSILFILFLYTSSLIMFLKDRRTLLTIKKYDNFIQENRKIAPEELGTDLAG